jgi:hypothetical protein
MRSEDERWDDILESQIPGEASESLRINSNPSAAELMPTMTMSNLAIFYQQRHTQRVNLS